MTVRIVEADKFLPRGKFNTRLGPLNKRKCLGCLLVGQAIYGEGHLHRMKMHARERRLFDLGQMTAEFQYAGSVPPPSAAR